MNSLLFATYLATLTVKERCFRFDCKTVKVFNQRCEVTFDGRTGSMLGLKIPLRQYLYGPVHGFDGNNGVQSMTLFFESGRLYKAYVSQYKDKDTYDRWTCVVKNKRACVNELVTK